MGSVLKKKRHKGRRKVGSKKDEHQGVKEKGNDKQERRLR